MLPHQWSKVSWLPYGKKSLLTSDHKQTNARQILMVTVEVTENYLSKRYLGKNLKILGPTKIYYSVECTKHEEEMDSLGII